MKYVIAILALSLASCTSPTFPPTRVISADFNGDGVADRVDLYHSTTRTEGVYECVANVSLILDGTPQHVLTQRHSGRFPGMMDVRAFDLNSDGADELIVATYSAGVTHTYMTILVMKYDSETNSFIVTRHLKDIKNKNLDEVDLSRL